MVWMSSVSVFCVSSSQCGGLVSSQSSWSHSLTFCCGAQNFNMFQLGDNCIQNFDLGRYIVRYTVGNLVLR